MIGAEETTENLAKTINLIAKHVTAVNGMIIKQFDGANKANLSGKTDISNGIQKEIPESKNCPTQSKKCKF